MFKKLKSLGGSKRHKYRIDCQIGSLDGLPDGVARCRVVWARQAKVSVTKTVAVSEGKAQFNEELSQIATLTRDGKGNFDAKEYQFKLQAPERGNPQKYVTLGKAVLDMARFAAGAGDASPSRQQSLAIRMQLAQGQGAATLSVSVSAALVKGMEDDDITSVVTGGSDLSVMEQDLSGFDASDSRRASALGASRLGGTPSMQRVTEDEAESAPLPAQAQATGPGEGDATVRRLEAELAAAVEKLAVAEARQQDGNAGVDLTQENARLAEEVEGLKAQLAASSSEAAAAQQAKQQLEVLQKQNHDLEGAVQALKAAATAAAAAAAGAAAAGAVAPGGAGATGAAELAAAQARVAELEAELAQALGQSDSAIISKSDSIQRLQNELQDAQTTIAALQDELSLAKSSAALSSAAMSLQNSATQHGGEEAGVAGVSPEVAAKLVLYEEKIQQLMQLVEQHDRPQSDREAELEARLQEAEARLAELDAGQGGLAPDLSQRLESTEAELAEAETMANEAMNLLEAAQEENRQLHEQLHELRLDVEWQAKKAAKEKADWEARMQDGFRRVEESVLLAERLQAEKGEMQRSYDLLLAERNALEAQLDPQAVDQHVAAEAERARVAAEHQARIEVEALQARIREMEEFVERADAGRLEAAGQVTALTAQLSALRRGEQDSFDLVKVAEERADGLQLEVQVLSHEKARLEGELTLAREGAERAAVEAARAAENSAARAAELGVALEEARALLRAAEAERGELSSKVAMLEEDLESSKLQAAEVQQKLLLATAAAGAAGAAAGTAAGGANGEVQREQDALRRQLEERKRAGEERAAQLEATSRELSLVRASLQQSETERDALRAAVLESERAAATAQSRIEQLEEAVRAREVQAAQLEQLQRDMAAAMLAAKEHNSAATSLGQHKGALEAQLAELRAAHASEVGALTQQLEEAHALADYSSRELAGVVQALAEAEAERGELGAKANELREELARMRTGDDGELRVRIERLEKELVVTRNARDVNALFKSEHDRIANELIETKLLWAEAQEQIVKLKQALARAQEKNISFASKLTRLETKFYKKLKPDKDKKKGKKGSSESDTS